MSYKYFSSIRRCSCPKKFKGEHCEIGMGEFGSWGGEGQGGGPEISEQGEMGGVQKQGEAGFGGIGL